MLEGQTRPITPLGVPPYRLPFDVPVSLRHNVRSAHAGGLDVLVCVQAFGLPVDWVEEFVKPDPKPDGEGV